MLGKPQLVGYVIALSALGCAAAPPVAASTPASAPRLPPVVIQRIVRQSFDKLHACYDAGLGRNAGLTGRVNVRFAIGLDGTVIGVDVSGSDMPDPAVTRCVAQQFGMLRFPQPKGGIVIVTYPIVFAPGG
jgi:hypothetical protein